MNIHKNVRTTPHSRGEIARRVVRAGQPPADPLPEKSLVLNWKIPR